GECGEGVVDVVEGEEVVGGGEEVVGRGRGAMGDDVEEGAVLRGEAVVEDLAASAELMGAGADEGGVLEVLVPGTLDGVEVDVAAFEDGAGGAEEVVLVAQPLADAPVIAVDESVGPQAIAVDVVGGEEGEDAVEGVAVLHAPGDLLELDAAEVGALEEGEDLVGGAVLGDVGPRGGVDAGGGVDDVEDGGGGEGDELA